MSDSCCDHTASPDAHPDRRYRRVLSIALAVNLAMFVVEMIASVVSHSVSLRADASDFLGDGANYGLALIVLAMALRWRAIAAH